MRDENGKHNILGENLQKIKSSRKDWCGRAPKTCLDGEIFAVASVLAPGTLSEERRGWICSHRAVGQQQQGIQSPLWWAELIPLFPSDFWHLRYSCYFCLVGCRTQCFCLRQTKNKSSCQSQIAGSIEDLSEANYQPHSYKSIILVVESSLKM